MGIDIQCSERTRMVYSQDSGEREAQSICTGVYLQREIMDCEIQFLIDSVQNADYISDRQREELVQKLEVLQYAFPKDRACTRDPEGKIRK